MFARAVIPVNTRESIARIERLGLMLKQLGTRGIVLLHVGREDAAKRRRMEKFALALEDSGVRPETLYRTGSPALTIVRTAAAEGADVLAVSWRRRSWLQRAIVGSTTQDIVRMSSIPVVVSKSSIEVQERGPRLLYATSFQESDAIIMPYIRSLRMQAERLILLHAGRRAPDPVAEGERLKAVYEDLRRLAEDSSHEDVQLEALVGKPSRAIRRCARQQQADMVIIGRSDGEASFGSTAEAITTHAPASLLIVPVVSGRPAAVQTIEHPSASADASPDSPSAARQKNEVEDEK